MGKEEKKRYRSPDSLWRVIRRLPEETLRRIRRRLRDTRLGWLCEVLRKMNEYDSNQLEELFRDSFPESNANLLRVYKKQLWDLIEDVMATEVSMAEGGWRSYKRLLASFQLWMMGEYETAFVLWRQGMEQAIQAEEYEVALRGVLWLELYMRDFHWISARSETISGWVSSIMTILEGRYHGLIQKVAALESYVPTRRQKRGITMPDLPASDRWGTYFGLYARVLEQVQQSDFLEALRTEVRIMEAILLNSTLTLYERFQIAVSHINMLILLLNYRERCYFEIFYELWEMGKKGGVYPEVERFEALYRLSVGVRLARYIQEGEWSLGYSFLQKEENALRLLVFHSLENLGLRLGVGVSVCWLAFQFGNKNLSQRWMAALEDWIIKEGINEEVERLWYELLLWYMAHVEGYVRVARYQVRRLRVLWQTHHLHDERWRKLLLVVKHITKGSFRKAGFIAKILLEKHESDWYADETTFPVLSFLEKVKQGRVLYPLSPRKGMPRDLPVEFQKQMEGLIQKLKVYMKLPPVAPKALSP